MKVNLLSTIITLSGLIFTILSLALIFLGKKVGEKDDKQQRIKVGKYVEVNTNSVITLILIMACFSITPLILAYWKPDLTNYVEKNDLSENYMPLEDLSILIYGAVVLEDGSWADNVKMEIIRNYQQKVDTLIERTGEQGEFLIELQQTKPMEKYTIIWSKDGYAQKKLKFGFNEYPFPLKLSKNGEN